MQVAQFFPEDISFKKKQKNSLKCSCEKLKTGGKILSVCDICSEKEFLKRSHDFSSPTESSTFSIE